jgi:AraC-like DNA-binding protein
MFYRERELPATLGQAALCAWHFSLEPGDPPLVEHKVPPDGTTNFVLVRDVQGDCYTQLIGPTLAAYPVPVSIGWTYCGLRLRPETAGAITGKVPPVGTAEPLPLDGKFAPLWRDLQDFAAGGTDWAGTVSLIGGDLRADRQIAAAVERIILTGGTIPVSGLAGSAGLSERQFRRRFHGATGVAPKQFAAVQRVRRALILSLEDPDWAGVASEAGFADQPHLAREVKDRFGAALARVGGYFAGMRHELVLHSGVRFLQDDLAEAA